MTVQKFQSDKVKISDIFFVDTNTAPTKKVEKKEKPKSDFNRDNGRDSFSRDKFKNNPDGEFAAKGTNIKLEETYDIHFTIGSIIFKDLITFINDINYDTYIIFRQKEVIFVTIDPSNTHASVIKIEKSEFLDSILETGIEDESEKIIFIDTSIITEELSINENYPIDFYVDTVDKRRFYVVCNKAYVWRQTTFITEAITTKYKFFKENILQLITNPNYQRVIINQFPLMSLFKSLSKKKKKDSDIYVSLYMSKNALKFTIEDENKGSNDILSGEDILVYPINEDKSLFVSEFFTKFGNLNLTNNTNLYVYGTNLPIILESRLGGGKIMVSYLIAPRAESE